MVASEAAMLATYDIMEQLSYAYVHAVAAHCGYSCQPILHDRDSIDATIRAKGKFAPNSKIYSPVLDLQLKASSTTDVTDTELIFELKKKNYDDLTQSDRGAPAILVVLVLPELQCDWLVHSEDCLTARNCAYFIDLKGMPECDNVRSKTIRISRRNVFSPDSLRRIMYRCSMKEDIGDAL